MTTIIRIVGFVIACAMSWPSVAVEYRLKSLGVSGFAGRINDKGEIALTDIGKEGQFGAVYRDGGVDILSSYGASAWGIDAQGDVVGWEGRSAVLWPRDGGEMKLPSPKGNRAALATAINSAQVVAGYYFAKGHGTRCFTWTQQSGSQDLGFQRHSRDCRVVGINDHMQIAGTLVQGRKPHAFLYENGHVELLPLLPGSQYCGAGAINQSGDVVGYCHDKGSSADYGHPVLWHDRVPVDLSPPGSFVDFFPGDINDAGTVLGSLSTTPGGERKPALYTSAQGWAYLESMVVNLDDWTLNDMTGISVDGVIAGMAHSRTDPFDLVELVPVKMDGAGVRPAALRR